MESDKEKKGVKLLPRNTENGKYHYICNPTQKNISSPNFCVNGQFLKNPSKDFLFEWTNPFTGEYKKKVIHYSYIEKYSFPRFEWHDKLDEKGNPVINRKTGKIAREKGRYLCHQIPRIWVERYEELVLKGWAPAPRFPLAK